MTNEELVMMGEEAERLLDSQLLEECFDAIRQEQFKRFENSTTDFERDDAHKTLKGIAALKRELRKFLSAKQKILNSNKR